MGSGEDAWNVTSHGTAAVLIGLVASRVAASVACGLREKVFNKVIAFSDAEINKFSTASLITRSTMMSSRYRWLQL